ncbi:MAG: hypothetical protein MHM6MM_001078, partial [Cercozoa sp. M6MM]
MTTDLTQHSKLARFFKSESPLKRFQCLGAFLTSCTESQREQLMQRHFSPVYLVIQETLFKLPSLVGKSVTSRLNTLSSTHRRQLAQLASSISGIVIMDEPDEQMHLTAAALLDTLYLLCAHISHILKRKWQLSSLTHLLRGVLQMQVPAVLRQRAVLVLCLLLDALPDDKTLLHVFHHVFCAAAAELCEDHDAYLKHGAEVFEERAAHSLTFLHRTENADDKEGSKHVLHTMLQCAHHHTQLLCRVVPSLFKTAASLSLFVRWSQEYLSRGNKMDGPMGLLRQQALEHALSMTYVSKSKVSARTATTRANETAAVTHCLSLALQAVQRSVRDPQLWPLHREFAEEESGNIVGVFEERSRNVRAFVVSQVTSALFATPLKSTIAQRNYDTVLDIVALVIRQHHELEWTSLFVSLLNASTFLQSVHLENKCFVEQRLLRVHLITLHVYLRLRLLHQQDKTDSESEVSTMRTALSDKVNRSSTDTAFLSHFFEAWHFAFDAASAKLLSILGDADATDETSSSELPSHEFLRFVARLTRQEACQIAYDLLALLDEAWLQHAHLWLHRLATTLSGRYFGALFFVSEMKKAKLQQQQDTVAKQGWKWPCEGWPFGPPACQRNLPQLQTLWRMFGRVLVACSRLTTQLLPRERDGVRHTLPRHDDDFWQMANSSANVVDEERNPTLRVCDIAFK